MYGIKIFKNIKTTSFVTMLQQFGQGDGCFHVDGVASGRVCNHQCYMVQFLHVLECFLHRLVLLIHQACPCMPFKYPWVPLSACTYITKFLIPKLKISPRAPCSKKRNQYGSIFKASALWADAFYKSKCPSVCPSVCLSVRLFTFEVPLKRIFAPTYRSWMYNIFRDSESLGKSNGKKWSQI